MTAGSPSELELLVRSEVSKRLRVWGAALVVLFLGLAGGVAYLAVVLHELEESAVRLNQPVMIYHPAWETVIDAVDPVRFPGTHRDDIRKGTLVQQWPAHGGPQHIWELRLPYGPRYQGTNARAASLTNPASR